jgi:hypothetical protein
VMGWYVGSVGIETSILPEGDTFFSFRLCMVIYPAKATNNPHGLRVRLTQQMSRLSVAWRDMYDVQTMIA